MQKKVFTISILNNQNYYCLKEFALNLYDNL